jgi:hypothetical protein
LIISQSTSSTRRSRGRIARRRPESDGDSAQAADPAEVIDRWPGGAADPIRLAAETPTRPFVVERRFDR